MLFYTKSAEIHFVLWKNVVLSELFQESFNYEEFQQHDILGFVYQIVIIFGKNVH